MNKITYWMRKLGMLRTYSYKVSGDAQKLNEVQASNGGMIQSQKEIDEKYKESQNDSKKQQNNSAPQNDNQDKKGSSSKVLFWIFLVVGIILSVLILIMDFSVWFMLAVVMWAWFLHSLWTKAALGALMVGKTILIGIVLIIVSFFFINMVLPGSEEAQKEHDEFLVETDKIGEEQEKEQQEQVKTDKIVKFLSELEEGTDIAFGKILKDDDALWTSTNISLAPTDAKIMNTGNVSDDSWSKIKQYFKDREGHHGTIGFEFVDKNDNEQTGYLFDDGEYAHLMCILTESKDAIWVSCGWGPGGEK